VTTQYSTKASDLVMMTVVQLNGVSASSLTSDFLGGFQNVFAQQIYQLLGRFVVVSVTNASSSNRRRDPASNLTVIIADSSSSASSTGLGSTIVTVVNTRLYNALFSSNPVLYGVVSSLSLASPPVVAHNPVTTTVPVTTTDGPNSASSSTTFPVGAIIGPFPFSPDQPEFWFILYVCRRCCRWRFGHSACDGIHLVPLWTVGGVACTLTRSSVRILVFPFAFRLFTITQNREHKNPLFDENTFDASQA
jgi:hypothetical protein